MRFDWLRTNEIWWRHVSFHFTIRSRPHTRAICSLISDEGVIKSGDEYRKSQIMHGRFWSFQITSFQQQKCASVFLEALLCINSRLSLPNNHLFLLTLGTLCRTLYFLHCIPIPTPTFPIPLLQNNFPPSYFYLISSRKSNNPSRCIKGKPRK